MFLLSRFTSTLAAGALTLTAGTATPASAGDEAAYLIGGLLLGGVIGAAIADDNDRNRRDHEVSRSHRDDRFHDDDHHDDGRFGARHGARLEDRHDGHRARSHGDDGYRSSRRVFLPADCRIRNGHRSGYSGRCLSRHDYSRAALPSDCAVHVGGHHRTIYRDRCLNRYGYF